MALIILFDQIPRNIYRKTAKAYKYDLKSLKITKSLIENFDSLHFCFKLTIIICMIHSEDISDHEIIKILLLKIKNDFKCDSQLYISLYQIYINHYDRIKMFGRIPERNIFLGRKSTPEEKIYLLNI